MWALGCPGCTNIRAKGIKFCHLRNTGMSASASLSAHHLAFHYHSDPVDEGSINHSSRIESRPPPVFTNKLFLEHNPVHLFKYYLRLFLCCNSRIEKLRYRRCSQQRLKYSLSDSLQKKPAALCSGRRWWQITLAVGTMHLTSFMLNVESLI